MQARSSSRRDLRIDLLRGLALLSIFVDHIPNNRLADFTLHNFGFSDAADLFVILAGFSATLGYSRTFEREGLGAGLKKVLLRCLQIYGVQVLLLLSTLLIVWRWEQAFGMRAVTIGPMLRDGWQGAMRGVALEALPANLDILPLYIVLLSCFPLVRFGMGRSLLATLAASLAVYAAANVWRLNLPNVVDRASPVHWYFDPLAWQLVFVIGCMLATAVQRGMPFMTKPPVILRSACWVYIVIAFALLDSWSLWPPVLQSGLTGTSAILGIFGNEPKTYVSPWRLMNLLAMVYLALTSRWLVGVSEHSFLRPVVACGRNSLKVFAFGCFLALLGRLLFKTSGVTVSTQLLVNGVGLGSMLLLATSLERMKAVRALRAFDVVRADAGHVVP